MKTDPFLKSIWSADFFLTRSADHLANRAEALATEDPVGATTEYLYARENLRLARHHLAPAHMDLAVEVVREIDNGDGIKTPSDWALATKILKPLRFRPVAASEAKRPARRGGRR